MSAPPQPKELAENELAFFFSTNARVPAGVVALFVREVERIALSRRHLGPEGAVEIVEICSGTVMVRLSLWATIVGVPIAATQLGLDIADKLQKPTAPIAQCAARMVVDHGVVATHVITCRGGIEIVREMMPATKRVTEQYVFGYPLSSPQAAPQRALRAPSLVDVPEVYPDKAQTILTEDLAALFEAPSYDNALKKMRGHFKQIGPAGISFINRYGKSLLLRAPNPPMHLVNRAEEAELYFVEEEGDEKELTIKGIVWRK